MTPPSPALRVLMTTDAVGGAWFFAATLAREIAERGLEIDLVTLGPPPDEQRLQSLHGVSGVTITVTDLQLEWMDADGRDMSRARERLLEVERRLSPDIVHVNGFREAAYDWLAPVVVTAHSCVGTWWRACHAEPPPAEQWQSYLANVSIGLASAEAWTAPTQAMRDAIQEEYEPPSQGKVIWNGVGYVPAKSRKEPCVLAAGRVWDCAKNLDLLARIAADLDWPVRIAGPAEGFGTQSAPISASAAELLGDLPQPRLFVRMQQAAVFAAPALYEPFGLTVLEAATAGCALVLSDISSFRELWDGAAIFADPRDECAWREALCSVCDDTDLQLNLQQAARQRAQRYSLARTARSYLMLYRDITGARPSLQESRTDLEVGP